MAILRDFPKIVYHNAGEYATHISFNSVTLETSRFQDELKKRNVIQKGTLIVPVEKVSA